MTRIAKIASLTGKKFSSKTAARMQSGMNTITGPNVNFPGENAGIPRSQVVEEVINAPKVVGAKFNSAAGTIDVDVPLPSTAKRIIGLSFAGTPANDDTFNLTINNEKVISVGSVASWVVRNNGINPYFEFERYIAGSSSFELEYTSTAGGQSITVNVWYI